MGSNTKIVVLHMKEVIYTGIFAVLALLFIVLMIIMFFPEKKDELPEVNVTHPETTYIPGVYTTSILLNDTSVDIEVVVDENNINSIRMINLSESVATMYPLMEPSLADLSNQILSTQSVQEITYSDDNKYTSLVLLDAIKTSLEKAKVSETNMIVTE